MLRRIIVSGGLLFVVAGAVAAGVVHGAHDSPIVDLQISIPYTVNPQDIAVDPATDLIYVASWDGHDQTQGVVFVVDPGSGATLNAIPIPGVPYKIIVRGNTVFVTTAEGLVAIDAAGATVSWTLPLPQGDVGLGIAAGADPTRLYVVAENATNLFAPGALYVVDPTIPAVVNSVSLGSCPEVVVADSQEHVFVGLSCANQVVSVDPFNGTITPVLTFPSSSIVGVALAIDSDGQRLFASHLVAGQGHQAVYVVNTATRQVVDTFPLDDLDAFAYEYFPGEDVVVLGPPYRVVGASSGAVVSQLPEEVYGLAVNPVNHRVYAIYGGGGGISIIDNDADGDHVGDFRDQCPDSVGPVDGTGCVNPTPQNLPVGGTVVLQSELQHPSVDATPSLETLVIATGSSLAVVASCTLFRRRRDRA